MNLNRRGRKVTLAALCAALLWGGAFATEPTTLRDETTLHVRSAAGAQEKLRFEGALAPGERRALSTDSGNPATLTRTDAGLLLELAGERFEIAAPEVTMDLEALATTEPGSEPGKQVIMLRDTPANGPDAAHTEQHRVVHIVKRQRAAAGGDQAQGHALDLEAGDPEIVMLEGGSAPRVVVTRRIFRETETAQ